MAEDQTMTDLKDLAGAVEGIATPETPAAPLRDKQVDKQGRAYATGRRKDAVARVRSEEHTSELQSLMRISYAGFWLQKKTRHIETWMNDMLSTLLTLMTMVMQNEITTCLR